MFLYPEGKGVGMSRSATLDHPSQQAFRRIVSESEIAEITKLDEVRESWGAFDRKGRQLLILEQKEPACDVRAFADVVPNHRGRLLMTFLGSRSFDDACRWVRTTFVRD
jgi:hypothetical protein